MATRFEPLKLTEPGLFGVRMHGAFGRGDRQRLHDLARRCLDGNKLGLVFECSGLDSLGGSGAGVLADLQKQLVERGGELVFVAVGPVIHRFLKQKFDDLPLRCFDDIDEARAACVEVIEALAAPAARKPSVELDTLLGDYEVGADDLSTDERRTAELVTAAYVSLDDVLMAAGEGGNPTVLGEVLSLLLSAHDLAAEAVACVRSGDQFVSSDASWRVPDQGGIARGLRHTGRPLTMIDLEEGDLWDEETQLLEELQPDLILPLMRGDDLMGVAFLRRDGDDRDYSLAETFSLEMLQRLLAMAATPTEEPVAISDEPATERTVVPLDASDSELMLGVKLELVRGLQEAQDLPHFWQVFISRLHLAAEVTSLFYVDPLLPEMSPFVAGEARQDLAELDLSGERIRAFFRTLQRPVEIANMPASFAAVRDGLLDRGLHWLVSLRADDELLGVVALNLNWKVRSGDAGDRLLDLIEITAEALQHLRDGQSRANTNLGLLESLIVGEDRAEPDLVTRETVAAVRMLALELGLPPDQERDLVLGALVRNFGQENADTDDLTCDRLSGDEWEVFRAHPDAGDRRMAVLDAPAAVRDAVRHHHERFDGRGFPLGLTGRDIPLVARLVAVAQAYALALVRDDADAALAAVRAEARQSLDPDLVEIFAKAHRRAKAPSVPDLVTAS